MRAAVVVAGATAGTANHKVTSLTLTFEGVYCFRDNPVGKGREEVNLSPGLLGLGVLFRLYTLGGLKASADKSYHSLISAPARARVINRVPIILSSS